MSRAGSGVRRRVRKIVQSFGYDIRAVDAYSHKRPIDFIRSRQIDVVVDVGANTGQYAGKLRESGYRGWIISLEPVLATFQLLKAHAAGDSRWTTLQTALGRDSGTATINVSEASVFSSIRKQAPAATNFNREARVVAQEIIDIQRLDDLFPKLPRGRRFLKIDTQGFEKDVLEGGRECLARFAGVQMELPIRHLYQDVWHFDEAVSFMRALGFGISNIIPISYDHDDPASLLEVDCIFRRLK